MMNVIVTGGFEYGPASSGVAVIGTIHMLFHTAGRACFDFLLFASNLFYQ